MRVKGTNVSPENCATVVSQHPVERLVARFLFFSISEFYIYSLWIARTKVISLILFFSEAHPEIKVLPD